MCWFSRRREFHADAGGARLSGRDKMIAALERLKGAQPEPLPDSLAAFGIRDGARSMMYVFSTHPPLEERIRRLRESAI